MANMAVLEAQARAFGKEHRAKKAVIRQEKALELVEELDKNPQGAINYDWYLDYDVDLGKDIFTYVIVSRQPVLEVQYGERTQSPEAEDYFGYFKYEVLTDKPIDVIKTPRKEFKTMGVA